MNQVQQRHATGTFRTCACGREPRHFHVTGRHPSEAMPTGGFGVRHMLECSPCGKRTARHASVINALREWGEKFTASVTPIQTRAAK